MNIGIGTADLVSLLSSAIPWNGHKLTHASKKPHGCQFCDKSYSDARSLRRHYENAHPDEYESWCFLSRAAEEGEVSIAEAVAKMTQLSAAVATSSASASVPSTGSNGTSLAQQLVGAKAKAYYQWKSVCMAAVSYLSVTIPGSNHYSGEKSLILSAQFTIEVIFTKMSALQGG
eukprot:TsM_000472200 transcript=TsM_000472200 gene=TsM_000472200